MPLRRSFRKRVPMKYSKNENAGNREKITRTEYSMRNTSVALVSRITAIVMGYLLRVVFTHTLSESYVGLNGLFIDIISVLSLSEMGISTAITFALYRPIAEGDIEKQKSLMLLYRRFYRGVVAGVAVLGLALIPFMRLLIKDYSDIDHLILIYLLYLANTVCSYLLVYKKTLLDAQQKMYIGVFYQTLSWVIMDILKIIVLLVWKNFILFLAIEIVTTLACNFCISRAADRRNPYLRDKDIKALPMEEKKEIFSNIRAMMMHKAGAVIVNNTDNLMLSAFVGLLSVGSYSNYYLLLGSVKQILNQVYQGITASVGNLGVMEDEKRVKRVFEAAVFIGQWMYGVAFICLFELLNPFVEISFGKQFLFSGEIMFVLCLNFYLNGLRNAALTFRDSMGLFWHDRYKAILEAGLNIVFSLVLVNYMGTIGVFLGTLFSMLLSSCWIEPYILYKYGFKCSCKGYFLRQGLYIAVMAAVWLVTDAACSAVAAGLGSLYAELLVRLALCMAVSNVLLLLIYGRTADFKYAVSKAAGFLKEKLKMHKN